MSLLLMPLLLEACKDQATTPKKDSPAGDTDTASLPIDTGSTSASDTGTVMNIIELDAAIVGESDKDQYSMDNEGNITFYNQLPLSCGETFSLNLFSSDPSLLVSEAPHAHGCAPDNEHLAFDETEAPQGLFPEGCLALSANYFTDQGTVNEEDPPIYWTVWTLDTLALDTLEESCEEIEAGSENEVEIPFMFRSEAEEGKYVSNTVSLNLSLRGGGE